jgi:hypothetical protein
VTISLDVTNRETLLQQLSENTVDLVIMGQPPVELDAEADAFMENPLVIVAPPDHPLAREKKIPLARLQEEIFLVREPGSGTRIAMERFFAEREMHLKTGMEVGSNEAIKQSVQAGLGLGLLSRATIEQELTLKRLVVLDVAEFPIMRHWYLVHRRGKRLSAVAEAFRLFMLKETHGLLHERSKPARTSETKKQKGRLAPPLSLAGRTPDAEGKTRLAGQKRNTTEAPISVCVNPSLLTLTTQPPEQKIALSVLTAVKMTRASKRSPTCLTGSMAPPLSAREKFCAEAGTLRPCGSAERAGDKRTETSTLWKSGK